MENSSIVDTLIVDITADQKLLQLAEIRITEAKNDKQTIVDRLKDYRKDMSVLMKYVDDTQKQKLEELGYSVTESAQGINAVATLAFDIILKAKDNTMTNLELYEAYKRTFKDEADAFSYTEFNIKCRSLFNTQKLIRTKGKDPKSSKGDIISLNGSLKKETTSKK